MNPLILLKCNECKSYFFTRPLFTGDVGTKVRFGGSGITTVYTCPEGHSVSQIIPVGDYVVNNFGIFQMIASIPMIGNQELLQSIISEGKNVNLFNSDSINVYVNNLFRFNNAFVEIFSSFKGTPLAVIIVVLLAALSFYYYQCEFSKNSELENINIEPLNYIK